MITFGKLTDLTKKLKALSIKNGLFFVLSQNDTTEYILFLNRKEQIFDKGLNLEGDILGAYSLTTESLSAGQSYTFEGESKTKKVGEPFFLFDSGELFDSFQVKVDLEGVQIDAYTIKEDGKDLESLYGCFVGLNNESKSKLVEFIKPLLIEWLKNTLTI